MLHAYSKSFPPARRSAAATAERTGLIAPHGGKLVNLMLPEGAQPRCHATRASHFSATAVTP